MPFETETETEERGFLLMQAFFQICVPRCRMFMHALRPTTVEIPRSHGQMGDQRHRPATVTE
jgi:hypothetical protein